MINAYKVIKGIHVNNLNKISLKLLECYISALIVYVCTLIKIYVNLYVFKCR